MIMSALDNLLDGQEKICYVQCGFCATVLLVSVPCSSLSMVMTVRCGHCNAILPMKSCFVPLHLFSLLNQQEKMQKQEGLSEDLVAGYRAERTNRSSICFSSDDEDSVDMNQVFHKPPEKKQRAPSAYNHFVKEEIKRLKIEYPNMTHKQAFSTASKNWAHFPQSQQRGEVSGSGEEDIRIRKSMYLDVRDERISGSRIDRNTP